ncbi:hypothetical protein CF336_g9003 [Tilletia laevis]|uniref:Uncharacterized protein n=1 Tax=Tilletia caries TaxID=13290 RepID=A0A177U6I3_9BASI|nr:hypothetical protein CF336_g9003 [Tilletia laevis]KAE8182094.1 hypothetical protein CF335_g8737 [Tilletia laevis]KAE8239149.1 hypothetical protein A4X03_0g8693 [Tilletia caries]
MSPNPHLPDSNHDSLSLPEVPKNTTAPSVHKVDPMPTFATRHQWSARVSIAICYQSETYTRSPHTNSALRSPVGRHPSSYASPLSCNLMPVQQLSFPCDSTHHASSTMHQE